MKKISLVIIVILILVAAFLFYKSISAPKDNAAFYYLKAASCVKYPTDKAFVQEIRDAVDNGIKNNAAKFQKLISDNKKCLALAEQAFKLEKCDFTFGKKYKFAFDRPVPPSAKLRDIYFLTMIKARTYEKEGYFDKAVDSYINIISLPKHISQDNTLVAKMVAIAVEGGVFKAMKQYIEFSNATNNNMIKILSCLTSLQKEHFKADSLVSSEKNVYLSIMESQIKGFSSPVLQSVLAKMGYSKKDMEEYQNSLIQESAALANKYYGRFEETARINDPKEWESAVNGFASFVDEVDTKFYSDLNPNEKGFEGKFLQRILGDKNLSPQEKARKYATIVISIAMPNYTRAFKKYYEVMGQLDELIALTEAKAYPK